MPLYWRGAEVQADVLEACRVGVNRTMGDAVSEAQGHHPFQSETGRDVSQMQILQPARINGTGVEGQWGDTARESVFLELGTHHMRRFPTLRAAGDKVYPRLPSYIAETYNDAKRL